MSSENLQPAVYNQDLTREFVTPERCHILETYNSEREEELSIARARLEPGVTTVRHAVRSTVERYLIVEGSGRVEIEGLPPTEVGPGYVVVIPADVPQRIANTGAGDLVFFCICTPRFRQANYRALEE
jgi:mannose-6-phosphate isomerase-like protein (cupin superfamily)